MAKSWVVPATDRLIIRSVKQSDLHSTVRRLIPFFGHSRWLGKTNRYAEFTAERIARDCKSGGTVQPKAMSQYIVASALLHCSDGWSYLGNALQALLRGDAHRVVHLAYYAELRAAMSLLASRGIGVFRSHHFAVTAPDVARKLNGKAATHQATWAYLRYWATLPSSGELLASVVKPGGLPLSEWFSGVGGSTSVFPQARKWLNEWSFDLSLLPDDRETRNASSYRPDGIPSSAFVRPAEAVTFATELWEACEPSVTSPFDNIDRYLLRAAAEGHFRGVFGKRPSEAVAAFAQFAESFVNAMAFDAPIAKRWIDFLTKPSGAPAPLMFELASITADDPERGTAAILSRALLLLRIATGSSHDLLRSAGLDGDILKFWWSPLGVGRGLWTGEKVSSDLIDLWQDIAVLIEDVHAYQRSNLSSEQSCERLRIALPHVISSLGGFERVPVWTFAT